MSLSCFKPKARKRQARNANWCARQAASLAEPVRDPDRCIPIALNAKSDKCAQAQPKCSWQFESKRSYDDKVLAATGDYQRRLRFGPRTAGSDDDARKVQGQTMALVAVRMAERCSS